MAKTKEWTDHKRIKAGDQVIVLTGNDRGMIGKVLSRENNRAIVQGINVRKKHMKRTQEAQQGGIVEIERPIQLSNLALCPNETPVKLHAKKDEQGNKVLYYREGDKIVDYRNMKTAQK